MVPITSQIPMAHRKDLPDEILTQILVRLTLRSISRFKTVCRRWKSAMESFYFRRLFVSVHQNSSCGWSLRTQEKEPFNFHGCQTWGLPKSIASYLQEMVAAGTGLYLGVFSFSGLVLVQGPTDDLCVGNPVLQEWVTIPPRPYLYPCIPFGQRRSCNLKTKNYKNLRDDHHQGFYLNQSLGQEYLHGVSSSNRSDFGEYDIPSLYLFQLVLPQWMESMPCSPQLEMMDTTSHFAYVASLPKK